MAQGQFPAESQEGDEPASRAPSLRLTWAEGSFHLQLPSEIFAANDRQYPILAGIAGATEGSSSGAPVGRANSSFASDFDSDGEASTTQSDSE